MSKLFIIGAGGFGKEVASASIISKIHIQSGTEIAANQVISYI